MSIHDDIKATLESPGAAHILRAFREAHKGMYRRYRDCTPDQLAHLQAAQRAIDTTLPQIIERMMNAHVQKRGKQEWFFMEWAKKIKSRVEEEFDPAQHVKVQVCFEGGDRLCTAVVPIGYDPSTNCVEDGPQKYFARLPDGRVFPIVVFPFGVVYDGVLKQSGISPWRNADPFTTPSS